MYFADIIGQDIVKAQMRRLVDENRLAHALLITGAHGNGKLPMAVALAHYLLCNNRHDGDACGNCPTCTKVSKLIHSDLHFVYPVIKKKSGSDSAPVSDDYIFRLVGKAGRRESTTHHLRTREQRNIA